MSKIKIPTEVLEIVDLENLNLNTEQVNGKRFYVDEEGNKYPSVTTVTSLLSADQIKLWRERVGEEEANRVSKKAASRGTRIHQHIEDYLRKDKDFIEFDNLLEEAMFKGVKPVLDEIIPLALEAPLYSRVLQMAGRVDCVGIFEDTLMIIDFKTSSKYKQEKYAKGWYVQMSAYALMVEELTGVPIPECMALVCLPDGNFQMFSCNPVDYIDELSDLRKRYRNIYGV